MIVLLQVERWSPDTQRHTVNMQRCQLECCDFFAIIQQQRELIHLPGNGVTTLKESTLMRVIYLNARGCCCSWKSSAESREQQSDLTGLNRVYFDMAVLFVLHFMHCFVLCVFNNNLLWQINMQYFPRKEKFLVAAAPKPSTFFQGAHFSTPHRYGCS